MDICRVGCIHCMKCVKSCPAKAIAYKDGRISIDHDICLAYGPECGEACVPACPRSILRPQHGNILHRATPDPS